jgi:hypothetical protein
LVIILVLLAIFFYMFPEYGHNLFGIRLVYQAPKEDKRNLLLSLNISEGREVRGQGSAEEEIQLADTAKLQSSVEETTVSEGPEFQVDYKLTEVQSEQFAWNQPKPGKLSGFHWQARVSSNGTLGPIKLEEHSNALWNREDVAWNWLSAFWPALPSKRLSEGDSWTGEVRGFISFPEKPEGFALVLRPRFTLDHIRQEEGKTLAEFHWSGDVSGDEGSGTVTGSIEGRAVCSVEERRCLIAEFAMDAQGAVPLALAKGLDASDGVKLAWRQKLAGRVLRTRPVPVATQSPTNP